MIEQRVVMLLNSFILKRLSGVVYRVQVHFSARGVILQNSVLTNAQHIICVLDMFTCTTVHYSAPQVVPNSKLSDSISVLYFLFASPKLWKL